MDGKNISFEFDIKETEISGNRQLLKQVWTNLLDNAIKSSPRYSEIFLSVKAEDASAVIIVQDQGPGMDRKTQQHMFDKFFQGDLSHASEGNGLGLTLVRKIVELHQGEITVESSPGEGSSFILRLPLAKIRQE